MKRILLIALVIAIIATIIAAFNITVFAKDEILNVVWNNGFVGSNINKNYKSTVCTTTSDNSYRYTDIIEIPKTGTKITFTDISIKYDADEFYVSNTVYVFSAWKKIDDKWVIDIDCPNIMGTFQYDSIGQKKVGDGMEYTYITDRDNVGIRICYRNSANETNPQIYSEATTESSTRAQFESQIESCVFNNVTNKIEGLTWISGYVGSMVNTNGSANEARYIANNYLMTNIIKVAKKGTEITFSYTDFNKLNLNFYAVSIWNKINNHYVCTGGFSVIDTAVISESGIYEFKYTTSVDNEYIRLCYYSKYSIALAYTKIPDIYFSETITSETMPAETMPETTPIETISPETTTVETTPIETISPETTTVETTPIETISPETTTVETTPIETISPETTTAETTPIETISPETTTAETTPIETILPETTLVETIPIETTSVEIIPPDTIPIETTFSETIPIITFINETELQPQINPSSDADTEINTSGKTIETSNAVTLEDKSGFNCSKSSAVMSFAVLLIGIFVLVFTEKKF